MHSASKLFKHIIYTKSCTKAATIQEYNSNSTRRLSLQETKDKIAAMEFIQQELIW